MEACILAFYAGSGATLAFAIAFCIWRQARVESQLEDSYNEGMEDAFTQMTAQADGPGPQRPRVVFVADQN